MALQFNEPAHRHVYARQPYQELYGRNIDKMPELIKDAKLPDRLPLSTAGFMKLRLRALDLYAAVLENPKHFIPEYRKEVAKFFKDVWSNYADTGDAVLYHPGGNIKTDLDSATLRQINPKSKMNADGAVLLESGLYAAAKMPEFTREYAQKYVGQHQNGNETLDNRFWRVLARDPNEVPANLAEDPMLLRNYVAAENKLAEIAFGYNKNMGVYVSDKPSQEQMRSWVVNRLRVRSSADGRNRLGDGDGRLVGVAPEAPRLVVPPTGRLEQIVTTLDKHSSEVNQVLAA